MLWREKQGQLPSAADSTASFRVAFACLRATKADLCLIRQSTRLQEKPGELACCSFDATIRAGLRRGTAFVAATNLPTRPASWQPAVSSSRRANRVRLRQDYRGCLGVRRPAALGGLPNNPKEKSHSGVQPPHSKAPPRFSLPRHLDRRYIASCAPVIRRRGRSTPIHNVPHA
jgi:hypothetical protein